MIWLLFAIPAVVIVYLAARFSRFRHIAEPVVTVVVALGLIVAAIVWWIDEARRPAAEIAPPSVNRLDGAAERAKLTISDLSVVESRPAGVYQAKGTITNGTERMTDYIRLSLELEDCADKPCRRIGADTPLLLLSILPGESKPFDTFVTVRPGPRPVVDPRWTAGITDARLSDP
ncbi:hypothetical protein SAMN05880582_1011217 [Rhizobium sp. RU20A]|uniref:hypothetical protein n=1 Tax=Rhizobium sp. RU20A TaxID=1907412 RepID=UPI0009572BA5|nr:hypothetical protein [Rhizobium sp. RU20A]SIQ24199.1 hypothetical protein SAMN05880582_1011217 [Rhizobium sp. RU20A]